MTTRRPTGNRPDLAFTDPLTGLGNFHRFFDKIDRLFLERINDPVAFTVAIIDLDGFRPINDFFGRTAGDNILQQAALRLQASMDTHSTVARIGADEFAVLYPLVCSEKMAREQVLILIEILSAPYDVGGRTARLSASAGCSLFHASEKSTESLISKAEAALCHAKRSGRGRIAFYTHEMEAEDRRKTQLEQALRHAIAAGEVAPYFQPIVDLKTRRTIGFETLARWHDHEFGWIPPAVFIPLAEERGIIGPLAQLVLNKATNIARFWPQELFLSFNLSPSQLVDQNTAHQMLAILKRNGFNPRRLEIEITESGLIWDPASAEIIINEFRAHSMRISLDDFGTGQSSLSRLCDFPFDKLKIDRAFVASLLEDKSSKHIIRAIMMMCKGLGIEVVAEGIEEEAQASRLLQFGCDSGQGYLFGKPRDADATMSILRDTYRLSGSHHTS